MTKEQALAIASARLRLKQQAEPSPEAPQPLPETAQQPETAQPAETYSGWVKGLRDPVDALSQMLYESIPEDVKKSGDALNNWIAEKTGLLEPIPEGGFSEQLSQQEETYQAGRQAEGDEGIDWDRIGGNILSTAVPGVGAARAVAPASTLGKVATGVGTGAAYGTLTPTQEEDFWPAKAEQAAIGAALGGAIPGVGAAVGKGVSYLDELTKPMYQGGVSRDVKKFLTEKAGPEREKIISALQQAREIVPGSRPTAGQAIAQATRPGDEFGGQFVKLESELARTPIVGTKLKNVYGEQAARREDIINAIAGTDEGMAAALAKRRAATEPLYKRVEKSTMSVDAKPVLDKIDDIIAKNKNETAITTPLSSLKAKLTEGGLEDNPQALMSLSKEIKNMMGRITPGGQKEYNVGVLNDIKSLLDDQIGKSERAFKVAQAQYKRQSRPINRMQVGQELRKALVSPTEQERATSFLGAMREAPRTLKRATGFKRYEDLGDVLTPEQTAAAKSVSEELVTQAKAKAAASGTKSIMADLPGEVSLSLPHILSRPVVVTNHILSMIGKDKTPQYKEMLADILKDPGSLEKALQLPAESAKAKMAKDIAKEIAIMTSVKTQQRGE